PGEGRGRERSGEACPAGPGSEHSGGAVPEELMGAVVARSNLVRALRRVRQNQGSPGIDGMTVDELPTYLRAHWPGIREALLAGTYQPQAVRRHQIPKAGGGVRQLGIPTVLDRFIQQALLQVLQPLFDPTSRSTATAFGLGAARTMPCAQHSGTSRRDDGGWSMWIWRSFSTGSTTTCSWGNWHTGLGIGVCSGSSAATWKPGSWSREWWWGGTRGRRKAARSRRFWRTCSWTRWIRRWRERAMRLAGK